MTAAQICRRAETLIAGNRQAGLKQFLLAHRFDALGVIDRAPL